MEPLDIILQEVRLVRKDLSDHIRDVAEIREDVHTLRTQVALGKQQNNVLVAGISLFVSSIVAWFVAHFKGNL